LTSPPLPMGSSYLFLPLSIAPIPPCAGYLPCCGRSKRCVRQPKFPASAAFPIYLVCSQICACKCVDFAFRISWLQIVTQLLPQLPILTNTPAYRLPLVLPCWLVQRFTAATQLQFRTSLLVMRTIAPVTSQPHMRLNSFTSSSQGCVK
jgi:hypothetical protein